jgi:hypothetical protein
LLPGRPRRLTLPATIAVSLAVAAIAAIANVATLGFLPPQIHARHLQVGAASTHVLVDAQASRILDERLGGDQLRVLAERTELFANVLASPPTSARIAKRMDIARDDLATVVRLSATVQAIMRDPDSEMWASLLVASKAPYRLDLQSDPQVPVLHIFVQAPSGVRAVQLANVAVDELRHYLSKTATRDGVAPSGHPAIEQLGPARGGDINATAGPQIAILTFGVVFCACFALLLVGRRVRLGWTAATADGDVPARPDGRRAPADEGASGAYLGDWPHTTRVLPWMLAGFMVMLWLVPFDTVQLSVSLPFDMKLDRLVLPFIFGAWILAFAAGGAAAPRIRWTWIHFGIGLFVALACISVVLGAQGLNQTLELDLATKRLVLLVCYFGLFVIVASVVRRSEVHAFMKFTLALAILCALGTVWEYRFHYNVFYSLTDQLLPSIFHVSVPASDLVDNDGSRSVTRGPAEHPLEAVAMLSMALPIALVGITHAKKHRDRILYSIAACIIVAAAISTARKSALLAPLAVCLTLAYFRRRELLKLAPLAVVCFFLVHLLSPGAIGSITEQFQPDQLGVGTINDRASDYDAVRPEIWSHLLLGRGYGSYDHIGYRVLDSEFLNRLVDVGVLGLLSSILMLVIIVGVARRPIRSRHPQWAPPALAIAAAAVAFLVLTFLFDESSFPHTPYILMCLAAFLVIVIRGQEDELEPPAFVDEERMDYEEPPEDWESLQSNGSRPPATSLL